MRLWFKLVRRDMIRNRIITTALAVFLILSALLLASGLRVAGTMISAMNGLDQLAIPPEYLQMHLGPYDDQAFTDFVANREDLDAAQVVQMLNINNASIIYRGETLEKCLMDNGFVIQNEKFDYLLNLKNEPAVVHDGEIGVPVYYAEELDIRVGETITLREGTYQKQLVVSTLIRDAAMNAALTSSKRFLVSPADQADISRHMGEWEYCFEFLLAEDASPASFEMAYRVAGMPANGVAITGRLLTMLNNFSYGLIALIIMAISLLLILIAVLCLSYIIRATLADEHATIGEMKAIGLPGKAISRLYQIKYTVLVLAACLIGYLASIPFGDFFSSSVILYCGFGPEAWMKWIFPLVGLILLSLIVLVKCRRILRKNLQGSVVALMRGEEPSRKGRHYSLPTSGLVLRNVTIALGELSCHWREYIVVFCVLACSSFLLLLPMNMTTTLNHPSFMTYMGVGACDIRIDIQYTEQLQEQMDDVLAWLEQDQDITRYAVFENGTVQVQQADGSWENIRVSYGDESVFPLAYLEGTAPLAQQDIALSYLNAADLGKSIGDSLKIECQGEEVVLTVSGIYQDITYGGKTAKAALDLATKDVDVYLIYLDVRDGVSIEDKTDELRRILTESKITPIDSFIAQTLGGISDSLTLMEGAAIVLALLLTLLVSAMIMQLITAREHRAIAIKKAIGLTNADIRKQYGLRILLVQVLAIVTGTVLANTLGEVVLGWMLSSMGAAKIRLLIDPIDAYLFGPAAQLSVAIITLFFATQVVRKYHIREQVME